MQPAGGRYALYFAPDPAGPLWRFGSRTLGYDASTGAEGLPEPPPGCEAMDWRAATEEPRRYGFHATLKAPFELRADKSAGDLVAALAGFASRTAPLPAFALEARALGAFVALVPAAPNPALQALAFGIVEAFEPFRAPLGAADRARRLKSPLTRREIDLLDRYGYPYVGDAFRFHMTLTGRLAAASLAPVRDALARAFRVAVPSGSATLDALALYHQPDRTARFRIVTRLPLTGT